MSLFEAHGQLATEAKRIGDSEVLTSFGAGNSAKVKLARDVRMARVVALKVFKKAILAKKPILYSKLQREIALMSLLEHPHILRVYEVFESDRHLYIVMEYAENRELFDLLVSRKRLSEVEALELFRQLIYALDYLHRFGICHRDLKPENILLDSHMRVKLGDFGFARWMRSDVARTSCGSPHYTAPEVIRAQPYDGRISDIWSSGVILFTMLAGRRPFDDGALRNLLVKIKKGDFEMPPFEDDIQDLIYKILVVDPGRRISLDQIKQHPAFLRGLPDGYVLPAPLPLPQISGRIDPSSIQPQMLKVLRQIGYSSDDELFADLNAPGHTMAKVFHYMLTRTVDRASLPWGDTHTSEQPSELAFVNTSASDFGAAIRSVASDACVSLVQKPDWAIGDAVMIAYEQEQTIENIPTNGPHLFLALQCIMNDLGFDWFHPDDMTLLARTTAAEYLVFGAECADANVTKLHVRMERGPEDVFLALMKRIRDVLAPREPFLDESLSDGVPESIPE
jgi:BR serine/threonine kinase